MVKKKINVLWALAILVIAVLAISSIGGNVVPLQKQDVATGEITLTIVEPTVQSASGKVSLVIDEPRSSSAANT